jgi:hypothetical protein
LRSFRGAVVTAAALVQFDPELVRDREVHFLSFPLGERIFSEIEAWTSSARRGGANDRAWDLVGIVVLDDAWVAVFTRPRARPGAPDCDWSDIREALASAYYAGALRMVPKQRWSEEGRAIKQWAAEYADKNLRAVGE